MLGIDPFETKDVVIDGVTYTIGIIPYRKRVSISKQLIALVDKEEKTDKSIEYSELYIEAVRWGLKGHKDFIVNGKQVEYTTEVENGYDITSDVMIEYYSINDCLYKVFAAVWDNNLKKPDEKKS